MSCVFITFEVPERTPMDAEHRFPRHHRRDWTPVAPRHHQLTSSIKYNLTSHCILTFHSNIPTFHSNRPDTTGGKGNAAGRRASLYIPLPPRALTGDGLVVDGGDDAAANLSSYEVRLEYVCLSATGCGK